MLQSVQGGKRKVVFWSYDHTGKYLSNQNVQNHLTKLCKCKKILEGITYASKWYINFNVKVLFLQKKYVQNPNLPVLLDESSLNSTKENIKSFLYHSRRKCLHSFLSERTCSDLYFYLDFAYCFDKKGLIKIAPRRYKISLPWKKK